MYKYESGLKDRPNDVNISKTRNVIMIQIINVLTSQMT